jgi:hypothetical protein
MKEGHALRRQRTVRIHEGGSRAAGVRHVVALHWWHGEGVVASTQACVCVLVTVCVYGSRGGPPTQYKRAPLAMSHTPSASSKAETSCTDPKQTHGVARSAVGRPPPESCSLATTP